MKNKRVKIFHAVETMYLWVSFGELNNWRKPFLVKVLLVKRCSELGLHEVMWVQCSRSVIGVEGKQCGCDSFRCRNTTCKHLNCKPMLTTHTNYFSIQNHFQHWWLLKQVSIRNWRGTFKGLLTRYSTINCFFTFSQTVWQEYSTQDKHSVKNKSGRNDSFSSSKKTVF